MPNRVPWVERKFTFDFPTEVFPEVIERMRGLPARGEDLVRGLTAEVLTRREGETWSIQENLAHLADVDEHLHITRLDEFERGVEVLTPADMSNARSHAANHNERTITEVLQRVRDVRMGIVKRLDATPAERFAQVAQHPRLEQPMRLVDLLYFFAEHDDYHLARVSALKRAFVE